MAAESNAKFITGSNIDTTILAVNDFLAANPTWNAVGNPAFYANVGWSVLVTKPT